MENAINAAVQSGRFASADEMVSELVREEARRSRQPKPPGTSGKNTRRPSPSRPVPISPKAIEELHLRWIASGLITQLPDPAQDVNDDDPEDQPVVIKGEPLSQTIIRERR